MEGLALHTGASIVNWENNTIWISVVEAKIVTPRVRHIEIPVSEQFYIGLSIKKI